MVNPGAYLQEVLLELKKVTWPTRTQTVQMTSLVIGVSLVVAMYIGILDFAFQELIRLIIK